MVNSEKNGVRIFRAGRKPNTVENVAFCESSCSQLMPLSMPECYNTAYIHKLHHWSIKHTYSETQIHVSCTLQFATYFNNFLEWSAKWFHQRSL